MVEAAGAILGVERRGGGRFLKLMKADRRVTRLLMGESPSKKRHLADTSILETLRQVRNETVQNMLNTSTHTAPAEDLGLDAGEQRPPQAHEAPHVFGAQGVDGASAGCWQLGRSGDASLGRRRRRSIVGRTDCG